MTRPPVRAVATAIALTITTVLIGPVGQIGMAGLAAGSSASAREASGGSHPVTYTAVVTDPDDTSGPLDVARVAHRVRTGERAQRTRISVRVRTFHGFHAGRLHPHRRSLVAELDTDGRPGAERNLRVSARNGEPVAELISNATRKVIRVLPMARPDRRTVVVSGARKWLGARRYFWTVTYHRRDSASCGLAGGYPVWCQDSVPDRGWIRMDRPAWPDRG